MRGATEDTGRGGGRKREIGNDVKEVKLVFFFSSLSPENSQVLAGGRLCYILNLMFVYQAKTVVTFRRYNK